MKLLVTLKRQSQRKTMPYRQKSKRPNGVWRIPGARRRTSQVTWWWRTAGSQNLFMKLLWTRNMSLLMYWPSWRRNQKCYQHGTPWDPWRVFCARRGTIKPNCNLLVFSKYCHSIFYEPKVKGFFCQESSKTFQFGSTSIFRFATTWVHERCHVSSENHCTYMYMYQNSINIFQIWIETRKGSKQVFDPLTGDHA